MISIEEIKQMIIKNETGWLEEIHGDDEAQMYVDGMIDEINDCKGIDDIADFYCLWWYSWFRIAEASHSLVIDLFIHSLCV